MGPDWSHIFYVLILTTFPLTAAAFFGVENRVPPPAPAIAAPSGGWRGSGGRWGGAANAWKSASTEATTRRNTLLDDADDLQRQLENEAKDRLQYTKQKPVWTFHKPGWTSVFTGSYPYPSSNIDEDFEKVISYEKFNSRAAKARSTALNEPGWSYLTYSSWSRDYPACRGRSQSPVAIPTAGMIGVRSRRLLKFKNYHVTPYTMTLRNDGKKLVLTGCWPPQRRPSLWHGATHSRRYIFHSVEVHWPSEHNVGPEQYPCELQARHYAAEYPSYEAAVSALDPESLLNVAYLYKYEDAARPVGISILISSAVALSGKYSSRSFKPANDSKETFYEENKENASAVSKSSGEKESTTELPNFNEAEISTETIKPIGTTTKTTEVIIEDNAIEEKKHASGTCSKKTSTTETKSPTTETDSEITPCEQPTTEKCFTKELKAAFFKTTEALNISSNDEETGTEYRTILWSITPNSSDPILYIFDTTDRIHYQIARDIGGTTNRFEHDVTANDFYKIKPKNIESTEYISNDFITVNNIEEPSYKLEEHTVTTDEVTESTDEVTVTTNEGDYNGVKNSIVAPPVMPLTDIFPVFEKDYATYAGSMSAPPCKENVRWIVYSRPLGIRRDSLAAAKSLRSVDGLMTSNSRPVQPLNDRQIYYFY